MSSNISKRYIQTDLGRFEEVEGVGQSKTASLKEGVQQQVSDVGKGVSEFAGKVKESVTPSKPSSQISHTSRKNPVGEEQIYEGVGQSRTEGVKEGIAQRWKDAGETISEFTGKVRESVVGRKQEEPERVQTSYRDTPLGREQICEGVGQSRTASFKEGVEHRWRDAGEGLSNMAGKVKESLTPSRQASREVTLNRTFRESPTGREVIIEGVGQSRTASLKEGVEQRLKDAGEGVSNITEKIKETVVGSKPPQDIHTRKEGDVTVVEGVGQSRQASFIEGVEKRFHDAEEGIVHLAERVKDAVVGHSPTAEVEPGTQVLPENITVRFVETERGKEEIVEGVGQSRTEYVMEEVEKKWRDAGEGVSHFTDRVREAFHFAQDIPPPPPLPSKTSKQ